MIFHLQGKLFSRNANLVVIDVQGVGYGVEMPLSHLLELPQTGQAISLFIYHHIREDAQKLFGFLEAHDRQAFDLLLDVNGVGPKLALAILSTLNVGMIYSAIAEGQIKLFESVPGIGNRMAEKIIVELKPKLQKFEVLVLEARRKKQVLPHKTEAFYLQEELRFDEIELLNNPSNSQNIIVEDLKSALGNLGFKEKEVLSALRKIEAESGEKNFEALLKMCLQELTGINKAAQTKIKDDSRTNEVDLF